MEKNESPSVKDSRHYFIDEAGDLTLFNKKGEVIIGSEGVSHTFMIGAALIPEPDSLYSQLETLRQELLNDPFLMNIPSMQTSRGKTALYFHAKDDVQEVRWQVFKLLATIPCRVFITLRRKSKIATVARWGFQTTGRKFSTNDVYDDLVKRLFKNLLHKGDENHLIFARRGTRSRQEALESAIAKAKSNFEYTWQKGFDKPTFIQTAHPSDFAGLQLIDYYLWAIQRLYERGDDRFFSPIAHNYRLIMDLDDTRKRPYGEWYGEQNLLSLEKLKPITG